jgi:DNA-directed RNA polymerase specialized sigma24 family protein
MTGYNRAIVEKMLPAVWDADAAYGMKNETRPDPDMPKGHVDKKKGSSFLVHIADVRQAWRYADLSLDEKRSVLLRYGLDLTFEEIAEEFGVNKSTTQRRSERGVGKLTAHLNGDKYIDGYDQLEEDPSE